MLKIIKYVCLDILKNRFMLFYFAGLVALTVGMFQLDENPAKAILSILNIVLLFVPLVCIMFSSVYYYNSLEFLTLILAQPLPRRSIFFAFFIGISASLMIAFLAGCGIPMLLLSPGNATFYITIAGLMLSLIFSTLAILFSVWFRDKARGMGMALILWIFFMVIFDGIVMFLMFTFADYPLEKTFIGITFLNPIDLARIFVLLQMDISALMGVTGAVFMEFFGTATGALITLGMMCLWFVGPLLLSVRSFSKKDF